MNLELELSLRLLLAGVLGILIGLEREYRAKEAGYRTHFLVSLGSALLMIVSQYGFNDVLEEGIVRVDPSRIAAQVVSGIGFIGAGTIIFHRQIVRGLTTAAGIWATAAIGLSIGSGLYILGCITTVLTLFGLEVLGVVFKKISARGYIVVFSTYSRGSIKTVSDKLRHEKYEINSYQLEDIGTEHDERFRVNLVVRSIGKGDESHLLHTLQQIREITIEQIE